MTSFCDISDLVDYDGYLDVPASPANDPGLPLSLSEEERRSLEESLLPLPPRRQTVASRARSPDFPRLVSGAKTVPDWEMQLMQQNVNDFNKNNNFDFSGLEYNGYATKTISLPELLISPDPVFDDESDSEDEIIDFCGPEYNGHATKSLKLSSPVPDSDDSADSDNGDNGDDEEAEDDDDDDDIEDEDFLGPVYGGYATKSIKRLPQLSSPDPESDDEDDCGEVYTPKHDGHATKSIRRLSQLFTPDPESDDEAVEVEIVEVDEDEEEEEEEEEDDDDDDDDEDDDDEDDEDYEQAQSFPSPPRSAVSARGFASKGPVTAERSFGSKRPVAAERPFGSKRPVASTLPTISVSPTASSLATSQCSTGGWSTHEDEACILEMSEVVKDLKFQGKDSRWAEVSQRLASNHNISRSGNAVKNQWNRRLRSLANGAVEDRSAKRGERLVTSLLTSSSGTAKSNTTSSRKRAREESDEEDDVVDKKLRRNQSSTSSTAKPPATLSRKRARGEPAPTFVAQRKVRRSQPVSTPRPQAPIKRDPHPVKSQQEVTRAKKDAQQMEEDLRIAMELQAVEFRINGRARRVRH